MIKQRHDSYKPNDKRMKRVLLFVWLVFGFEMIYLLLNLWEYHILRQIASGIDVSMKEISHNDMRRGVTSFFSGVTYLFSIIYFIKWFRRSYFNIRFFTKSDTRYKNGWAAACWFVPIINFYRPFLIMREIWGKTQDMLVKETKWNKNKKAYIVTIWWVLWLLATVFGKFIIHFIIDPWNIDELMAHTLMHIFASFLWIPLTLTSITMVKNYSRMEKILKFRFVDERIETI